MVGNFDECDDVSCGDVVDWVGDVCLLEYPFVICVLKCVYVEQFSGYICHGLDE